VPYIKIRPGEEGRREALAFRHDLPAGGFGHRRAASTGTPARRSTLPVSTPFASIVPWMASASVVTNGGKLRGNSRNCPPGSDASRVRMASTGEFTIADFAEVLTVFRATVYRTLQRTRPRARRGNRSGPLLSTSGEHRESRAISPWPFTPEHHT